METSIVKVDNRVPVTLNGKAVNCQKKLDGNGEPDFCREARQFPHQELSQTT
jgi:hypothetical protein